jgi:Coenzyme PQQ synthesis protein D (PqqD)
MLTLNDHLQPRGDEVAAKVIDGEAIIINLANGIYYSMDKVGGLIWEMIEGKQTLEEIITATVARYDVSREQAQVDVELLVNELLRENLITAAENGAPTNGERESEQQEKLPYETPKLNIYRDMGDLLALDPPVPGLAETPWKDPTGGSSGENK